LPIEELLAGWTVLEPAACVAPVDVAAATLAQLGATRVAEPWDPWELRLVDSDGTTRTASLAGWTSENALSRRLAELDDARLTPTGAVLGGYAGARLAGELFSDSRTRLPVDRLIDELLVARPVRGRIRPEILRCRDGWAVARFREDDERALLEALVGPTEDALRDELVAEARVAQLLVAPVRAPDPVPSRWWDDISPPGAPVPAPAVPRIVDWTVLWAGPWATGELRRDGADVMRIEHPRRRDGLLRSDAGTTWWDELNGAKRLGLHDARDADGRRDLVSALEAADILFTSMTPRALASLGFDDAWREDRAPGLLHVELVAFDDPWSNLPGLGEHAAAEAGLLWRGDDLPVSPYSWPDPLLGAVALLVGRAWLASRERRGGRVRLTLQRAAALAFSAAQRPSAAVSR
jgi:CoA transferase family III